VARVARVAVVRVVAAAVAAMVVVVAPRAVTVRAAKTLPPRQAARQRLPAQSTLTRRKRRRRVPLRRPVTKANAVRVRTVAHALTSVAITVVVAVVPARKVGRVARARKINQPLARVNRVPKALPIPVSAPMARSVVVVVAAATAGAIVSASSSRPRGSWGRSSGGLRAA